MKTIKDVLVNPKNWLRRMTGLRQINETLQALIARADASTLAAQQAVSAVSELDARTTQRQNGLDRHTLLLMERMTDVQSTLAANSALLIEISDRLNAAHIVNDFTHGNDVAAEVSIGVVKTAIRSLLVTGEVPRVDVQIPLPFSRASGSDYLRLVELWNQTQTGRIAMLPARDCPACSSNDHRAIFTSYDGYPYNACNNCGTWFVPLRVTDAFIETFLIDVPEARVISDRMMAGREQRTREGDRERFGHYFDLADTFFAGTENVRRYLDIGCGVGHSLDLAQERGMTATGLEVNPIALATARSKGRNVCSPDELKSDSVFDFISMFETLEHVTDPSEVIKAAVHRLAPGGIVMITVPNRASWEISLKKEKSFHIYGGSEGTGHINLFDANSLTQLFSKCELRMLYADGQFSSNVLELYNGIVNPLSSPVELGQHHGKVVTMPQSIHSVLNSIGPYLSQIDRLNARSPILLAMACRADDVSSMAVQADSLVKQRRHEIEKMIN